MKLCLILEASFQFCFCESFELLKGLDVLVNNAGILLSPDFLSVSMEEVDKSMQVDNHYQHDLGTLPVPVCQSVFSMLCHTICPQINLKSALKLSQEAIPHLSVNKGNIVNVSSISGLR